MVAIESLVLVQEIALGNEAAIQVAISEVDYMLTLLVDVRYFFSRAFTEGTLKYQKVAVRQNDSTAKKRCMAAGFPIEKTRDLQRR